MYLLHHAQHTVYAESKYVFVRIQLINGCFVRKLVLEEFFTKLVRTGSVDELLVFCFSANGPFKSFNGWASDVLTVLHAWNV